MKTLFATLFACTAMTLQAFAQDCCYTNRGTDCFGFDALLTYDIGGGYRQDYIQWETSPESAPDSELKEKWKKLQIGIIETNAQFLVCDHYLTRLDFDYGWFQHGGHQKISIHNAADSLTDKLQSQTRGHVYNIDGTFGYQFNLCDYRYSFAPLVGYSYHFQKLKNDKYSNELDDTQEHVKNNYKYRWRGPTLGFITAFQIDSYWQINFVYAYHWARYRAKIAEKFNPDRLPSFQKSNNGHGNEFALESLYEFCPNWVLCLKVDYKVFAGHKGSYKTVTAVENAANETEISPLHDLRWTSLNATIDVMYVF